MYWDTENFILAIHTRKFHEYNYSFHFENSCWALSRFFYIHGFWYHFSLFIFFTHSCYKGVYFSWLTYLHSIDNNDITQKCDHSKNFDLHFFYTTFCIIACYCLIEILYPLFLGDTESSCFFCHDFVSMILVKISSLRVFDYYCYINWKSR